MRRLVIILPCIFNLIFFGTSVSWSDNAAYCETTQVLEINDHTITKSRNEKFRIAVSTDAVNFGINSFSGGTNSFKMKNYRSKMDWQANSDRFYISFLNGNLYFSAVFPRNATLMSAKCQIY